MFVCAGYQKRPRMLEDFEHAVVIWNPHSDFDSTVQPCDQWFIAKTDCEGERARYVLGM